MRHQGEDRFWRLCNRCFAGRLEIVVIIPLYNGKGKRTKWGNYRGISLSVVEKIYGGILEDGVRKVTEGLIDD